MVDQARTSQSNSSRLSSKHIHCYRTAGLRCSPLPVVALVRCFFAFVIENQTPFSGEAV